MLHKSITNILTLMLFTKACIADEFHFFPSSVSRCSITRHTNIILPVSVVENVHKYSEDDDEYEHADIYEAIKRDTPVPQQQYLHSSAVCQGLYSLTTNQLPELDDALNLTEIRFINSNISLIPVGVLNHYKDLNQLFLNNSNVETIHPAAFTLKELTELHLENNHLNIIAGGVLNTLPNLKTLFLNHNNISEIEDDAFLGLFKLKTLDVSYNKLSYIAHHIFKDLYDLREVYLSHNDFIEFTIESVPQILVFHISENQLSAFNLSIFPSLNSLVLKNNYIEDISLIKDVPVESLDLSGNKLTNINSVEDSLVYLNVSENQIAALIDDTLFNSSDKLQTLDFSVNIISNISVDVFSNLVNLRNLLLRQNSIEFIPVGCFRNLKNLTVLNLSSNLVTDLEYGTFTGLTSLAYLDISNNKLSVLYDSSLHPLKNLRVLSIANNYLTNLDVKDLMDISKRLNYISLDNNSWECSVLTKTIRALEKNRVYIQEGLNKKEASVHGISCSRTSKNTDFEYSVRNTSAEVDVLQNVRRYFDIDFLKSEFYKYFENLRTFKIGANVTENYAKSIRVIDNAFENTKLYKFINSDTQKTNSLKQLVKDLTNVMQSLNSTKVVYSNITFQNNLRDNLIESNIVKPVSTIFEKRLSEMFNKIDTSLDKIFNNSRFANFFDYMNLKEKNIKNAEESLEHFSAYTANRTNNEPPASAEFLKYLDKLENRYENSSNKNESNNNTLFSVVIVILLAVICFMIFTYFSNRRSKKCSRSARVGDLENGLRLSGSRIQMI